MSDDSSGPSMLRMVRFRSVQQDAERLRAPLLQDPYDALSRTIHMGDPDTAMRALVAWAKWQLLILKANPRTTPWDRACISATYYEFKAKILGRQTVMATELGHYSQNVAPDYGKVTYRFEEWANPGWLRRMFNEGSEVVIQGHMGTGKSHLAVLFMECLLRLRGIKYHIITNVSGVRDPTKQYSDRVHVVSRLSEILRIWCDLPPGTKIFLVLDEPESSLRGGSTKNVKTFSDFRNTLRKLGIAKAEIWHNESEQYRALREENSEQLYRIMKERKDSFTLTYRFRKEVVTKEVEEVPENSFLKFATRGMASIDVDVNMGHLISRIAKLYDVRSMKRVVRESLQQPRFYHAEFQDEEEVQSNQAAKQAKKDQENVARILREPKQFLRRSGTGFDPVVVRRELGLGLHAAEYASLKAWEQLREQERRSGKRPTRGVVPLRPEEADTKALAAVRHDSKPYLTTRGTFDVEAIRRAFGLTHRGAQYVARQARKGAKA